MGEKGWLRWGRSGVEGTKESWAPADTSRTPPSAFCLAQHPHSAHVGAPQRRTNFDALRAPVGHFPRRFFLPQSCASATGTLMALRRFTNFCLCRRCAAPEIFSLPLLWHGDFELASGASQLCPMPKATIMPLRALTRRPPPLLICPAVLGAVGLEPHLTGSSPCFVLLFLRKTSVSFSINT